MTDPRLIDMEPGGESTQYESIREYTQPPEKQTGQLGGSLPHTKSEMKTTLDNGKNGAPNENGDENGMVQRLGMGQGAEGWNNKEKPNPKNLVDAEAAKTRREQGYGPGSGVGA